MHQKGPRCYRRTVKRVPPMTRLVETLQGGVWLDGACPPFVRNGWHARTNLPTMLWEESWIEVWMCDFCQSKTNGRNAMPKPNKIMTRLMIQYKPHNPPNRPPRIIPIIAIELSELLLCSPRELAAFLARAPNHSPRIPNGKHVVIMPRIPRISEAIDMVLGPLCGGC